MTALREFARTPAVADALADALDHMHVGVIVVSSGASILFTNESARQILGERDGVFVCNGTLQVEPPPSAARLSLALARVSRMTACARRQCIDVIAVERQRLAVPLQICVTPLSDGTGTWLAGLFLSDPTRSEPSIGIFQRLYGLTPAEARLAAALVREGNAGSAAESLGVSVNTARSHIKVLYRKTSTRGQGELMRLLASGLGTLHVKS